MRSTQYLNTAKHTILILLIMLLGMGLLFVYSSSALYALHTHGNSWFYAQRQIITLILGIVLCFAMRTVSLEFLYHASIPILLMSLAFTALPLAIGTKIFGATRWIKFGPLSLQPSEFLKGAFVLYTAAFLTRKRNKLHSFWKAYLPIMLLLAGAGVILLKQPDFGCLVTIFATVLCMLFIGHMNMQYLGLTLASALPLFGALIYFKPYRFARILTFLNPWQDPQGAGFQIIQSLIAVGSGGIWGTGIGQSKQKFFYLPMQHTDFIFAIIAEETGFVGASLVIITFAALTYALFAASWYMKHSFSMFVIQGTGILISIQTCINVMVTLGMLPTKGISLPFISYGNSALLSQMMLIGIAISALQSYQEPLY